MGHKMMDHIWSISDEASVDETNFALDLIEAVTSVMEISPLAVQVGVSPKRTQAIRPIRLKDHDNKVEFWRTLDDRRVTGTRTDIHILYIRTQGTLCCHLD